VLRYFFPLFSSTRSSWQVVLRVYYALLITIHQWKPADGPDVCFIISLELRIVARRWRRKKSCSLVGAPQAKSLFCSARALIPYQRPKTSAPPRNNKRDSEFATFLAARSFHSR
jgi:hypothetical protein